MRRVAIFAHFDPQNIVKRYVVRHLIALREVCDEVHFASTSNLATGELAKLDGIISSSRLCENIGYDFAMWQQMLGRLVLRDWDELVLTNSSIFGPLTTLADLFERMKERPCDFWGLTDNLEMEYHIQSYFLVFRRTILRSGQLEQFFASVLPYRHKWQVIRSYELGLTHFLLDQGFAPDVVASVFDPGLHIEISNPCMCAPLTIIDAGVPYVKVELLRDNPYALPLGPVRARMAALGYPLDLVEVERSPRRRPLRGLINLFRLRLRRWRRQEKLPILPRHPIASMLENRRKTREAG